VNACDDFIYTNQFVPILRDYKKEIERNRLKIEKDAKKQRILKNKVDMKTKRRKEIIREEIANSRIRPFMNDKIMIQNVTISNLQSKKLFI
jgi:hypothetical protein